VLVGFGVFVGFGVWVGPGVFVGAGVEVGRGVEVGVAVATGGCVGTAVGALVGVGGFGPGVSGGGGGGGIVGDRAGVEVAKPGGHESLLPVTLSAEAVSPGKSMLAFVTKMPSPLQNSARGHPAGQFSNAIGSPGSHVPCPSRSWQKNRKNGSPFS